MRTAPVRALSTRWVVTFAALAGVVDRTLARRVAIQVSGGHGVESTELRLPTANFAALSRAGSDIRLFVAAQGAHQVLDTHRLAALSSTTRSRDEAEVNNRAPSRRLSTHCHFATRTGAGAFVADAVAEVLVGQDRGALAGAGRARSKLRRIPAWRQGSPPRGLPRGIRRWLSPREQNPRGRKGSRSRTTGFFSEPRPRSSRG